MQYQVPQFIEIEDRITRFLTFRQFIYLTLAGIVVAILYFFLQFTLWAIVGTIIGVLTAAFAFLEYNGRPISMILGSMIFYLWRPRIYIWKRKEEVAALRDAEAKKLESPIQALWLKITTGILAIPKRELGLPPTLLGGAHSRYQVLYKTSGEKEMAKRIDYK